MSSSYMTSSRSTLHATSDLTSDDFHVTSDLTSDEARLTESLSSAEKAPIRRRKRREKRKSGGDKVDDDEEEDESDNMGRNENSNAAIVVDSLLNKEYSDIDEVFDVGEAFIHQKGFTAENRNRNQETKNQDLNPVKKVVERRRRFYHRAARSV